MLERVLKIKAQTPTQNPEIPKSTAFTLAFFEKFVRTSTFFPVTRVRNPTEIIQKNCSDALFIFGWIFRVDCPPVKNVGLAPVQNIVGDFCCTFF